MKAIDALKALGPIDAKSVHRDPLLRWMIFYPILLTLVVRWGVPALAVWLKHRFLFDLVQYYPLLMSFVLLLVPLLFGVVIGFLLLDQRDDDTLTALQVTPLTLNGYLAYRLTVPILLSVVMTMIVFPITGLAKIGYIPLLIASVATAPLAPIFALFYASFARNKVQGFALMKNSGVLIYPPLFAYFVSSGWQWSFGIFPTYWPAKLFWVLEAGDTGAWFYLLTGLVFQFCVISALLHRFNRVMHQ